MDGQIPAVALIMCVGLGSVVDNTSGVGLYCSVRMEIFDVKIST